MTSPAPDVSARDARSRSLSDPDSPVIYSFSANPNQIAAGDCASLSWSVGGGTSMVRLLRDDVYRAAIGEAGRVAVEARYDSRRVYGALADVYAPVLGRRAAS